MNNIRIAIDPGDTQSAYVVLDQVETVPETYKIIDFGKIPNEEMRLKIGQLGFQHKVNKMSIEMVASYGMPVGKTVFDTVLWAGRFLEISTDIGIETRLRYRGEVKIHLCGTKKAKDGNIIQALKDRFGDKGTKAEPGYFYGFKADCWQAFALCITDFETE